MKLLISSLALAGAMFLPSLFAEAQEFDGRFDFFNPGRVTCHATDTGWEEHWGGHSSCEACLQKHGECVETCEAKQVQCTAVGNDGRGNQRRVTASASDRWSAEDQAIDRCSYRLYDCRIENCNERAQTVSRRTCRR